MDLDRIEYRLDMDGKACIRGRNVTVSAIVGRIGRGETIEGILRSDPDLDREDVLQALRHAAQLAEDEMPSDDDLTWLAESVADARRELAERGGLSVDEHRERNAERLARLST